MLIDLNMNPSPQDDFIVAQDRSFLKPRWSGKSGTSKIVSLEHAKASAALAASFMSALFHLVTPGVGSFWHIYSLYFPAEKSTAPPYPR
jgi:hypothetical protein